MQKVYRNAAKTLIWLGPDTDGMAKYAFDIIEKLGTHILRSKGPTMGDLRSLPSLKTSTDAPGRILSRDGLPISPPWDGVYWFYSRQWFSRLWVIQELNCSTEAYTICGEHMTDSFIVVLVANFVSIDHVLLEERLYETNIGRAFMMKGPTFEQVSIKAMAFRLHVASAYSASDPRDRVFAMLNSSEIVSRYPALKADYSLTTSTIFKRFAESFISATNSLELLSYVLHPEGELYKPSWNPRWDLLERQRLRVIGLQEMQHDASKNSSFDFKANILDQDELIVHGIVIDEISAWRYLPTVQELDINPLIQTLADPSMILKEWQSLLVKTEQYKTDEDIFLALGMTLSCGYNSEEHKINEETRYAEFCDFLTDITQGLFQCPPSLKTQAQVGTQVAPKSDSKTLRRIIYECEFQRRFFRTAKGYIGLGPRSLECKDKVAILFGGSVPFVLREADSSSQRYHLIGESYIHGIMDGAIMDQWTSGKLPRIKEQEILLI
jgi:Heterokaryon incompatibility protein (HET)